MVDINTADVKILKSLLGTHGIKMKKSLGQNFLTDADTARKISEISLSAAPHGENRNVLEIGAGAGALTYALANSYGRVVSVEYDRTLIPLLEEVFGGRDNIKFIYGDFLTLDLDTVISDEFDGVNIDVCANLPYYITTPILMKLLAHGKKINSMTLMLQREAALRVCAANGMEGYGELAVLTSYYGVAERKLKLPPSAFYPVPEVNSAVLKITSAKNVCTNPQDEKIFYKTVHGAFAHRRKTLVNSLAESFTELPRTAVAAIVARITGSEKSRAEQTDLPHFIMLADEIFHALR